MTLRAPLIMLLASCFTSFTQAQQTQQYDYFQANRAMINNGVQSMLMCNGLFTSKRSLQQVIDQELAYLTGRLGNPDKENFVIDKKLKTVAVGGVGAEPIIRTAFREGIGCVVLGPQQTFADIVGLPQILTPPLPGDPASIPWPMGGKVTQGPLPKGVDASALQAASNWAFDRETAEQDTLSLLVVHKGNIIHERYASGVDMNTRTRTWSTAKSIGASLIGMLVDQDKMALDKSLGIDWLPKSLSPENDPRNAISLRHVLNMSSGLDPVDSFNMEYATGSGLAYWAGSSSVEGARRRGLLREPGTLWDYENYDTLLAVYAMKQALGDEKTYHEFPRKALLDKLGMRNTLLGTYRSGDFIFISQIYTSAGDSARPGLPSHKT